MVGLPGNANKVRELYLFGLASIAPGAVVSSQLF